MTRSRWALALVLAAALLAAPATARASELAEFNRAVAAAYAHYRGAVNYLHTENTPLAAVELDDMAAKWRDVIARYAAAAPDAFADDAAWAATLRGVGARLDQALAAIDAGDSKAAAEALTPVRRDLAALRQRNGVVVFSDRIDEVTAAMDALWVYRREAPDLAVLEIARDIAAKTAVLAYTFERCREQAPAAIAGDIEFTRLIDGAAEGIARMGLAIDQRDQTLLINTLRELRSFEQILFLRYG